MHRFFETERSESESAPATLLEPDALIRAGQRLHPAHQAASPFPHIVLDEFFPASWVEPLTRSGRPTSAGSVGARLNPSSGRATTSSACPHRCWTCLFRLNSGPFLGFVEALTGIEGLVPEPHFEGAGMHQIDPGGYLKVHVDLNAHERLRLERRVNLLRRPPASRRSLPLSPCRELLRRPVYRRARLNPSGRW